MNTFDKKELNSRFWRYLSSSILITLSGALGVIVDSIIVGNLIGSDGVSAINLNSTVIQLLMTISLIIASGGGMLAVMPSVVKTLTTRDISSRNLRSEVLSSVSFSLSSGYSSPIN